MCGATNASHGLVSQQVEQLSTDLDCTATAKCVPTAAHHPQNDIKVAPCVGKNVTLAVLVWSVEVRASSQSREDSRASLISSELQSTMISWRA